MKKISILLGLLCCKAIYPSVYGEFNLGANFVNTSKQLTYPLGAATETRSTFSNGYNNFHGQLAGGYDFNFTPTWDLALEANLDLFTGRSSYNIYNWFLTTQANATEEFQYGFGFFALPEYQLNPSVQLFVGPGVMRSQYKVGSYYNTTGGNIGYSGVASSWLTGWGFKAGSSLALTDRIDLLLTYQYANYSQWLTTSVEPLSTSTIRAQYEPVVNTVMLGAKYRFDIHQPTFK